MRSFAWQEGSGVDATINYIRNQTEHHERRSFRAEFMAMLQKHGFTYEESMLV
jgi:putative transposase